MADETNVGNPLGVTKRPPGRPKTEIKTKVEVKPLVEDKQIGDDEEVKLTGKELKALKAMLASNQVTSTDKADSTIVQALITALREAQKPYKSEADKENDRHAAEQMRKMILKQLRDKEIEQTYCKHMAGTNNLSDVPHPANAFTAIAWHDITNQLRWGICTVCQRQFWPTDTDYRYWRSKRSYNSVSKAGERDNVDSKAWELEQHPEPFGARTGVDPRKIIQEANAIQF